MYSAVGPFRRGFFRNMRGRLLERRQVDCVYRYILLHEYRTCVHVATVAYMRARFYREDNAEKLQIGISD